MYFMGIDIGGTITKAGIYDVKGRELFIAEQYAEVLAQQLGFTERNMDELWLTVCHVIGKAIAQSGIAADRIKGISFSSHGKGLYAIDKSGKPVRNGIISSDTRALEIVKNWQKQGIDKHVYPKGLQQLWSGHPVSLLAWLKHYEPESYAEIDAILMVHDYIRFKLTGEIAAEITNISGSNFYNQQTDSYDTQMMAAFGLSEIEDKTARVIGSTELAGYVTKQAAHQSGLAQGTPVFGGMFDVVASAMSSGVSDSSTLSAVAGTWSIATTVTDSVIAAEYPYVWGKYCIPGTYLAHEGSPTSASNLAWMVKQFFNDDKSIYSQFEQWIKHRHDDSLVFLPYLFGSNYASNQQGGFIGLNGHHTKEDMIAAIYRGIVYSHLINQDRIIALNPQIKKIRFTGGPSKSAQWMQMYSDAGNLPLEVIDVGQSGCRAAAICAAVGAGVYGGFIEAIAKTTPEVVVYNPDPKQHRELRAGYQHYLHVVNVLSAL